MALEQARRGRFGWISTVFLWIGLLLCGYAIWKLGRTSLAALHGLDAKMWVVLVAYMLFIWLSAVFAWRQYVFSFTAVVTEWRGAFRQIGLLLVGKYIPGGIFGFIARLYAPHGISRGKLFVAGVVEQLVGAAMASFLGGICYASAYYSQPLLLVFALCLPPFAVTGVRVLSFVWGRSEKINKRIPVFPTFSRRPLLWAATASFMQQVGWIACVAILASSLFGLDPSAALGVAGSFGLAIGVGALVVVSPGGIGVREGAMAALASFWLGLEPALLLAAVLRLVSVSMDLLAGLAVLGAGRDHQQLREG